MDWPISWQKVKDSGVAIFDIADYGLRLDPINPVITDNVAIMYDVEKALNDGKTVYLKSDITSMGFNGYAVLPITMYTFSNGLGDMLARICASGLVPDPSMTGPSFLLAVNFLGRYGSGSKLSTVTMTTHRFVEEGSGSGLPVIDLSKYALSESLPAQVAITDASDSEVLTQLQTEEKPFIAKFARARAMGETVFNETYVVVMNFTDGVDMQGFFGTLYGWVFAIVESADEWGIQMAIPE